VRLIDFISLVVNTVAGRQHLGTCLWGDPGMGRGRATQVVENPDEGKSFQREGEQR